MKQGTKLVSRSSFTMKAEGRRKITVKPGDVFIVTSPAYRNLDSAIIDREKAATINFGYLVSVEDINKHFEVKG